MRAVSKKKVPELQDLGQRGRAGTHGKHRSEGVDPRLHVVGHEVLEQLWIDHLEDPIDESQALVHALHGATHIAGTLVRNELLEGRERLDLAAGGVEKGPTEHIHALHVANLLGVVGR